MTEILQSLLPELTAIGAAIAIVVVAATLAISRKKSPKAAPGFPTSPQTVAFCSRCGQSLGGSMMFCPNCGNPLSSSKSETGVNDKAEPPVPPPG